MSDEGAMAKMAVLYRKPQAEGLVGTCQKIGASPILEVVVVTAIVINTLFLMFQNPANSMGEGTTLMLTVGDLLLSTLFTVEMFIRIFGMGFIGHRGYLDDAWNKLDFVVVFSSWVNIMVELFDFDLGIEVSTLRALRILRVLRSLRFFSGIKTILSVVYSALPLAYNVVVFIAFLFSVCGIIGVQMFRGATIHRCAPGGYDLMQSSANMKPPIPSESSLAPEIHSLTPVEPNSMQANLSQPSLVCDTDQKKLGLTGEYPIGIGMWHNYCGVDPDTRKLRHSDCPLFNETMYKETGCSPQLCFVVPNPGKGVHTYDNILYAWVALFINMAQLYWWETAHRYHDANAGLGSDIAWSFGLFNVMFLTYVSVNMFVAVITTVFADVRSVENQAGGMAQDSATDKFDKKKAKYEKIASAWKQPPYYVAIFGGPGGPYEQKQKPNQGTFNMSVAMRDKVEVTAYFPLKKAWLPGVVIQLDDAEKKYKIQLNGATEEEAVWVKRKRIKVPAEMEKAGMINNTKFDQFILFFIFLNTIALASEHHDPSACDGSGEPEIMCQADGYIGFMGMIEYVFNFVFTVECLMKILGMGFSAYIAVGFNKLDFFIVVTSALDMLSEALASPGDDESGMMGVFKLFRVFRLFRVLRVARVLYRNENLKRLLQTVFGSGEALGNLTLFIVFSTLLFGIMGMHLFGGNYIEIDGTESFWGSLNGPAQYYKHSTHTWHTWGDFSHNHEPRHTYGYDVGELINKSLIPRRNFEDMPRAFLLAFQIITGDDWVNQMHDHMAVYNIWAPPLLFYTAFVFCAYTLLSLFIAVILENFEIAETQKMELQKQAAAKKIEDEEKAKSTPKVSFINRMIWCVKGEGYREGSWMSYARPAKIDDEGYFIPGEKWYNDDLALFTFAPDNGLRVSCTALYQNKIFDMIILTCIIVSSIMLAAEGPAGTLDQDILDKFALVNHFMFAVFMFEFFVKIIAMGFMFTPRSYLKDPWNKLDFGVILASVLGYIPGQEDSKLGRIFRLLRCLRPLRIINRNEGMKVIITAVINSLGVNLSVLMLAFMLLLIFGILGVNLFAGQFFFCTCSHVYPYGTDLRDIVAGEGTVDLGGNQTLLPTQVVTKDQCLGPGYHHDAGNGTNFVRNGTVWGIDPSFPDAVSMCAWENAPYNFDDTWEAIMALFTASTLAGWTDIMERSMDMGGFNRQPVYFNSWWAVFYFIVFVFIMAFFITNLFIGVLIDFIGHSDGTALLTEEQQKWLDTQRFQKMHKNVGQELKVDEFPAFRKFFYKLVTSGPWDLLSNGVILFNVFIMMLEHEQQSDDFWNMLEFLNLMCLIYFTVEMFFKLFGLYPVLYWKDSWNKFDGVVVSVSWLAIILDLGSVQAVRAFRAFRIVLVLKRAKGIRSLFGTLMMSIPAAFNISVLLILLYALYAILGMQLFGNEPVQDIVFWRTADCRKGLCTDKIVPWGDYEEYCGSDPSVCTPATGRMLHGGNRQYTSHTSFRNFFDAMGLLFQCASGQDWKFVMYALISEESSKTLVFWYFATFFFFSNYILMNLFVATILDNFSACLREEELEIREEDIVTFKETFRRFSSESNPDVIEWIKLESFLMDLGTQPSVDGDDNEVEFPMGPPPKKEWEPEQEVAWKQLCAEHAKDGAIGVSGGQGVFTFMQAAYEVRPLVDDNGALCNPLYGWYGEPGGFYPGGDNSEGGNFDEYWKVFISTRTTSEERPGLGDTAMEEFADKAQGDDGYTSFQGTISFDDLENFSRRLRFRAKYDHVVKELNFHGHFYESSSSTIRYTHLLQAMVNVRLGEAALSLEEQVERGLITIEEAQDEVSEEPTSGKSTSENPLYTETEGGGGEEME